LVSGKSTKVNNIYASGPFRTHMGRPEPQVFEAESFVSTPTHPKTGPEVILQTDQQKG